MIARPNLDLTCSLNSSACELHISPICWRGNPYILGINEYRVEVATMITISKKISGAKAMMSNFQRNSTHTAEIRKKSVPKKVYIHLQNIVPNM